MSLVPSSEVLTLEEVADYLRLPTEVVLRQAACGELPGRKIEDHWRFLKSAINAWLSVQPDRMETSQQTEVPIDSSELAKQSNASFRFKLERVPNPANVPDPKGKPIDLASQGIDQHEAAILRSSLMTFADDWNSPEMSIYDNYETAKANLETR